MHSKIPFYLQSNIFHNVTIFCSLLAAILVWIGTSKYGIGLSTDSVNYIAASKSLLSGQGYLKYTSEPLLVWPPLFPTLIAIFPLLGVEVLLGIRILHALVFATIIYFSGIFFMRTLKTSFMRLAGLMLILWGVPLVRLLVMAGSDIIYVGFSMIVLYLFSQFLVTPCWKKLFAVAVVTAFACLQRYVGVTLVLTGMLLIRTFDNQLRTSMRWKYMAVFACISLTPLVLWCFRNFLLSGTLTGFSPTERSGGYYGLSLLDVLSQWFFWGRGAWLFGVKANRWVISMLIIFFGLVFLSKKSKTTLEKTCGMYVLVYMVFIVFSGAIVWFNATLDRYLSSIYVFMTILILIVLEDVMAKMVSKIRWNLIRKSFFIFLSFYFFICIPVKGAREISRLVTHGAGVFSTDAWRQSEIVRWVRGHSLGGTVYSNAPDALYILLDIPAQMSPRYRESVEEWNQRLSLPGDHYLVWFEKLHFRHVLYKFRELNILFKLDGVATFNEGGIYRISRKKGK